MSVKQLTALFHHRYYYVWFHTQPFFSFLVYWCVASMIYCIAQPSTKVSRVLQHYVINGHKSHSSGGGSNGPEAVEDPSCANHLNCFWRDFCSYMMPQHPYTLYVVDFSIDSKVTSSYCIATHKHRCFCSSCCLGAFTPQI